MPFWTWSISPGANANADPNIAWPEGMSPSAINDSARQMMAQLAQFRDDTSGLLTTSGGPVTFAVTTNQGLPSPPRTGQRLTVVMNVTNGAAANLNADGGGAFALQQSPGVAVPTGAMIAGTPYAMTFLGGAWVLNQIFSFGNLITALPPIGSFTAYAGLSAPNSNWALPIGQSINQQTYATLFSLIGTTYGPTGGSGPTATFTLPDLRGRAQFFLDNLGGAAAGRISTALSTDGGVVNGQVLGSHGGSQSHAQTLNEMRQHGHTATLGGTSAITAGTVTVSGNLTGATTADHSHVLGSNPNVHSPGDTIVVGSSGSFGNTGNIGVSGAFVGGVANPAIPVSVGGSLSGSAAGTGTASVGGSTDNNGSSTAMALLPPMMIVGGLIRVL